MNWMTMRFENKVFSKSQIKYVNNLICGDKMNMFKHLLHVSAELESINR